MGRVIWTIDQNDFPVLCLYILLNEDVISAMRQGRARKYPRRLTGGDCM